MNDGEHATSTTIRDSEHTMSTATTESKPYLSPTEVSRIMGCSLPTVMRWIKSGELRSYNLTGSLTKCRRPTYRVAQEDLEEFKLMRTTPGRKPEVKRRKSLKSRLSPEALAIKEDVFGNRKI